MNKKIIKYLISISLLGLLILIYLKIDIVKLSVIDTSIIFIKNIFPVLFISSIVIKLLNNSILINIFNKNLKVYLFLISILSGCPTNAILLNNLLKDKLISSKDASIFISFTTINNPLFIYSYLKLLDINPFKPLLFIYLVNILPFIYFYKKIEIKPFKIDNKASLGSIIKESLNTMLVIYGTIVFFKLITDLLLPDISSINCLLKGLVEVTQGLECLTILNTNILKKELLSLVILLFSSFSIHNQISNILPKNINYNIFYIIKLLHILLLIIYGI